MNVISHSPVIHHPGRHGHRVIRIALCSMTVLCSWTVLSGQGRQFLRHTGEPAAPEAHPSSGAASTIMSIIDSLDISLIDVDIKKAEERLRQTSIWLRLIPTIHLTRSLPLVYPDPVEASSPDPIPIPYSPYRLTISFSLSDLISTSSHTQADLDFERLRMERLRLLLLKQRDTRARKLQLADLQRLAQSIRLEMHFVSQLAEFSQLKFNQGSLDFDQLTRAKIELLNSRRSLQGIEYQIARLQLDSPILDTK